MILDELKRAIELSPLSLRELAKETRVSAPTLSRFLRAERGLSYDNIQRLDKYFNKHPVKWAKAALIEKLEQALEEAKRL